jgi:hypothetical protein
VRITAHGRAAVRHLRVIEFAALALPIAGRNLRPPPLPGWRNHPTNAAELGVMSFAWQVESPRDGLESEAPSIARVGITSGCQPPRPPRWIWRVRESKHAELAEFLASRLFLGLSCPRRTAREGPGGIRRRCRVAAAEVASGGRDSGAQTCCGHRSCPERVGLSGAGPGSGVDALFGRGGRSAAAVGKGIDCGLRQAYTHGGAPHRALPVVWGRMYAPNNRLQQTKPPVTSPACAGAAPDVFAAEACVS